MITNIFCICVVIITACILYVTFLEISERIKEKIKNKRKKKSKEGLK